MTIQQAIKKAIEGGYPITGFYLATPLDHAQTIKSAVLDPLFWQALGKSMGWGQHKEYKYSGVDMIGVEREFYKQYPEWQYHQHRLIDHLAEGKDIESFFAGL